MKPLSVSNFSFKTAAKLIRFPGGERKFIAWLKQKGYLMANNEPYQRGINYGWFIMTTKTIHKANPKFTVPVTRVTITGLKRFEKIVKDELINSKPCP
jgi:phage antirepressor YoqD-like protein